MERVISVRPLEDYILEIVFEDGLRKVIDVRHFIAWPNGSDFCPNFLRDDVPAVKVVTA
jgi:hypothetical protein